MRKLEAAIETDLDAADAYLVYADWLQSRGDPRGELIALQHARTPKARRAEAALLAKHRELALQDVAVAWHLGFWKSARIVDNAVAVLKKLPAHPSARFLRHLSFGRTEDRKQVMYEPVIKLLAKQNLPHLRSLDFGDFGEEDWQVEWSYVGNLTALYAAFPALERLRVYGNRITLGTLVHPNLRELEIHSVAPLAPIVAALAKAKLPKLERLALHFAYDSVETAGLFAGELPALRHFELSWYELADADVEALCTGPTLETLETLALVGCSLTDANAEQLAAHAPRFAHLTRIDLQDNLLSRTGKQRVAKLCKRVRL